MSKIIIIFVLLIFKIMKLAIFLKHFALSFSILLIAVMISHLVKPTFPNEAWIMKVISLLMGIYCGFSIIIDFLKLEK